MPATVTSAPDSLRTITLATNFLHDPADAAAATGLETAWATLRPTVTGGSCVRGAVPTAIGNGIIYDFSLAPLIVPVSAGICGLMRNATGATLGVLGGFVRWDE